MKPENHCAICEIDYDALEEHIHKPLAPKRKPRKPAEIDLSTDGRLNEAGSDDDNLCWVKLEEGTLKEAKRIHAWLGKYIAWREAKDE